MPWCLFIAALRTTSQPRWRNSFVFDDGGALCPWDPTVRQRGRRGCLPKRLPQVKTVSTSKTKPEPPLCIKLASREQESGLSHLIMRWYRKESFTSGSRSFVPMMKLVKNGGENAAGLQNEPLPKKSTTHCLYTKPSFHTASQWTFFSS